MRRPAWAALPLLLLAAAASAACGGGGSALTVYSGRSEALVGPLVERFEEESGISVNVRYASSGLLAASLLEEGDSSPADVFFAQDPASLTAVEALLAPLPPGLSEGAPEWSLSAGNRWIGTSARVRAVVYNTEVYSADELPDTLLEYADRGWGRGRLGWAPANGSLQAMVTVMRNAWGDERTQQWLEEVDVGGAAVYASNTSIVNAVADGEADLGFVNHYYLHRVLAERSDAPIANKYLDSGDPGAALLLSGAGVLETSDMAADAERFIRFLLSDAGQRYFAQETFEVPVDSGVATVAGVPSALDLEGSVVNLEGIEETQMLMRAAGVLE